MLNWTDAAGGTCFRFWESDSVNWFAVSGMAVCPDGSTRPWVSGFDLAVMDTGNPCLYVKAVCVINGAAVLGWVGAHDAKGRIRFHPRAQSCE